MATVHDRDGSSNRGLQNAHTLLECFANYAETAVAALDAGRIDELESALEAREGLLPALDELLNGLSGRGGSGEPAIADTELLGLRVHAQRVQSIDTRLRVALGAEQQRLSRELDLLDDEEAIRSAYGQQGRPSEGRTINIVR